jgi:hypothetical protein
LRGWAVLQLPASVRVHAVLQEKRCGRRNHGT